MRYNHLYILPLAAMMAACSGGSQSSTPSIVLYPDSATMPQAEALVAAMTPQQTAATVVDWMTTADRNDGPFARRLSRDIMYQYISTGRGDDADAFAMALDSVRNTLSVDKQAHLLTVSASPVQLGRIMAKDPERDKYVPAIENDYANDSTALALFKEAMASESNDNLK